MGFNCWEALAGCKWYVASQIPGIDNIADLQLFLVPWPMSDSSLSSALQGTWLLCLASNQSTEYRAGDCKVKTHPYVAPYFLPSRTSNSEPQPHTSWFVTWQPNYPVKSKRGAASARACELKWQCSEPPCAYSHDLQPPYIVDLSRCVPILRQRIIVLVSSIHHLQLS
ncbi:uncharacterized protein BDV14DRAFT_86393 [Aspergillus stella-maris]|uniref:uncharacterized protein n=1 Tax=Aspergillus stella-maris TaxID=1810926 RepID=UPI003CCCD471